MRQCPFFCTGAGLEPATFLESITDKIIAAYQLLFSRYIGEFTVRDFDENGARQFDLHTHLARADEYRLAFRGYVEKGGEKFFHSDGRTAAVNISRVRKKLLLGQHFHRLLPCRRGGFFQIEFCGNGNDKHIKPARSRSSNERFVYAVYIFPERGGNLRARKRAAVVCMYFIVRTFFFDYPHCVCFRHNFTVE